MRRRRTWRAAVLAAALVAACSDGGGEERVEPSITAPSTTATTAPATSTTAEPERVEAEPPPGEPRPDIDVNVTYPADFTDDQIAVVDAYRGYWHAYYVARDPCGPTPPRTPPACTTDPDEPLLTEFATGSRLDAVRANLESLRESVAVIPTNGRYGHHVTDVTIDDLGAVVTTCSVDDAVVLDSRGTVVDDDVVTRRFRATLHFDSTRWLVTGDALVTLDEWNGDKEGECLASP